MDGWSFCTAARNLPGTPGTKNEIRISTIFLISCQNHSMNKIDQTYLLRPYHNYNCGLMLVWLYSFYPVFLVTVTVPTLELVDKTWTIRLFFHAVAKRFPHFRFRTSPFFQALVRVLRDENQFFLFGRMVSQQ